MNRSYDDIINLPHHKSLVHPPMPVGDRAAQFAPFAALFGYDADIKESERLTKEKIELDEHKKAELDLRIRMICESGLSNCKVTMTYFIHDCKKNGGDYKKASGYIKCIDTVYGKIIMDDGNEISVDNIYCIESDLFKNMV